MKLVLTGDLQADWQFATPEILHQILVNAGVLPGAGGFGFRFRIASSQKLVLCAGRVCGAHWGCGASEQGLLCAGSQLGGRAWKHVHGFV